MVRIFLCLALAATLCGAACAAFPQSLQLGYPITRWQFEPLVADADERFTVLDRRPEPEARFRKLDQTEPRYAYGDDQFFPTRMRVVATHFAGAFPRDATATQLVIEQLDLVDYVPRPPGDGRCHPSPAALHRAAVVLLGRALNPNHNSVTCRLSGSYAGIAFSVSEEVNYDQPGSLEHRNAVTAALLAAITKAINEVRTQRATSAAGDNGAYDFAPHSIGLMRRLGENVR